MWRVTKPIVSTLLWLRHRMGLQHRVTRTLRSVRWLLLLIPLCLSGCSSTAFLYNRLDLLITWYVDDYVALTREQTAQFDQRLDVLLLWHRQQELPSYAALIDQVLDALDEPIESPTMQLFSDQANAAADRLQLRITQLLIEFGGEITVEQRLDFLTAMHDNSERLKKKYLSRDEAAYRADLREDFASAIKRFMGKLTQGQKQVIAEGIEAFVRLDGLWLEDRDRWTAALEAVVARNAVDWQQQAQALMARRRADREVNYQRAFDHNAAVSLQIASQVLNARTEAQDKRLRRRLEGYRDDFIQLAQAPLVPNSVEQ